ncbi:hypothetical protein LTR08_004624 [Meristemomyces frigidus]|nr:hypothetical protein LTR08_004624 [Meristemomyces frigidus]
MRQAYSTAANITETRRRTYTSHTNPFEQSQLGRQLKHAEQPYLLLAVSRRNVLRDSFDQIWQRRRSELLLPLRLRLGERDSVDSADGIFESQEYLEIGQDLGGVQIEFFNAFCAAAFASETGMFQNLDGETGMSWFRPGSLQPTYMFELVGVVVGLAVYNGVTLPISLPDVFYRNLLRFAVGYGDLGDVELTPEAIKSGWPAQAKSLRVILALDSEEEVAGLGLDYSFPLEANGLRLSVHLPQELAERQTGVLEVISSSIAESHRLPCSEDTYLSGWRLTDSTHAPETVTAANKQQYIKDYVRWLTHLSVAPQLCAFRKGLLTVLDSHALALFTHAPTSLKALIEGSPHLDIRALRAATQYQGYDAEDRYIQKFWRIVESWPERKQLQLLKFVTAAERLPVGGAENVTFVISRAMVADTVERQGYMDRLPTTSTCFGTLFLPEYASKGMLERKLDVAIEWGGVGFGVG